MDDIDNSWRDAARHQIAARRFRAETRGIDVGGLRVATDRQSQALITGAALSAMRDPAYTVRWKTEAGFIEMDADTVLAVADAVRGHVQACFDREQALLSMLDAGEYADAMLGAGWPA